MDVQSVRFYVFFLVAVWNLVVIAAERYLAVCKPFKHGEFTERKTVKIILLIYFVGIILSFPAAFQVSENIL